LKVGFSASGLERHAAREETWAVRPSVLRRDGHSTRFPGERAATGFVASAFAIVAVTLVIGALKHVMDPAALTGLYLFAILPVAIGWGFWQAGVTGLASYLTFDFFFEPPVHSFTFADGEAAAALAISVVTAYVVSELARRAHMRAREARARAREAEEARASQRMLADEQAALRRVATLVARGLSTAEIFEAVTREVGLLCEADLARMERFEPNNAVTAIAAWTRDDRARLAVDTRFALEGASIAAQVRDTGRPARLDSFVGATGPSRRKRTSLAFARPSAARSPSTAGCGASSPPPRRATSRSRSRRDRGSGTSRSSSAQPSPTPRRAPT
jgi:K+-sensing histidine kinase KdpD